ncbi:MAG TPA: 3'-5' exonuclease [Candidatus Eremiobacteraceae bacterium]|nr:3'-5' exonuclease [Candidatus Eremiobacteraceae bacterium]
MHPSDTLLAGHGATSGIVAVEPHIQAGVAKTYIRSGGRVDAIDLPLQTWLLGRRHIAGSIELSGRHPMRHLLRSGESARIANLAREMAADQRLVYVDPITSHLVSSGETFFKGMRFSELRRLQFDLETLDVVPQRDSAEICLIGVHDSTGFERILSLDDFENEGALIAEFVRIVRERDPDIIEGHNIFNFDLWYLEERARRAGVALLLGRDGRSPMWRDESIRRSGINGMTVKYYRIEGRQLIDTFFGALRWDVGRRLPNYKLKTIVRHLGIGDAGRAMVDASQMRALWASADARANLKAYCLDDARDADRLSNLVTPNEFYQAQFVPESLQGLACVGMGSRIERLMVRAYLHAGVAIPRPRPIGPTAGGYTVAFETGVFRDVVKCDVESLYPSLMISRHIKPQDDDLDVFIPMLTMLRARRIEAKRIAELARAEVRGHDYLAADALQTAFKILINSFYGFLGTNGLHFNDATAAGTVTEAGRNVLERIVQELRAQDCRVIEADTDGAYFVAPPGADPARIIQRASDAIGEGLNLVCEERFAAMLSVKAKNYALRRSDGEVVLRGSALKSNREEPFGSALLRAIATALIDGRPADVAAIVRGFVERIRDGRLNPSDFARRESVTQKTFNTSGNRRLAQALFDKGVVVGDKVNIYRRQGGELALLEEYAGDEDRGHYLKRIADFVARFGDLISAEARRVAVEDPDQLTLL